MIDSIQTRVTAKTGGAAAITGVNMDLQELKAKHPEAYAAAVQVGVLQERERVVAHVTLGNASGDLKTAHESIEAGSELTPSIQAKYMAASMNRRDLEARTESAPAIAATNSSNDDESVLVAKLVCEQLGVEYNG